MYFKADQLFIKLLYCKSFGTSDLKGKVKWGLGRDVTKKPAPAHSDETSCIIAHIVNVL